MNLWPPLLFTGIRVQHLAPDWSEARVALRLRPWNRNYVGTQFGGSLFAMTDPFWMLLMMHRLGRDYIVWDRAAEIRFVSPGRSDVFARFVLDDERVAKVRSEAEAGRVLEWFEVAVTTASGDVVAVVRKQLYVKRKERPRDRVG